MNRRTWMTVGGLSLGALVSGLEPDMPSLWATEVAQRMTLDPEFSVILFWANGGPSQLDLFDLKPQAPVEYRGPFKPIRTNVPGIEITEMLPRMAKIADKYTLIRSLHHNRVEHSGGTNRFLTGYSSVQANLADSEFPELGSVVARKLEPMYRDVPLFIANTKFYGGGPAYLGPAYKPYMPSPNPRTSPSGGNTD